MASTFDTTRINRFLQNYTDPPINAHIHKAIVSEKTYIIIEMPAFSDTPHICQKEYPEVLIKTALYVRTANNESAPLLDSSDFRNIIERAVRNRSDALLESFRTILIKGPQQQNPADEEKYRLQIESIKQECDWKNPYLAEKHAYRETIFYPTKFNNDRYSLADLHKMAQNGSADFRGWPFLLYKTHPGWTYAIQDGLETLFKTNKSMITGGSEFNFWQLRQTGMLYTKSTLMEDGLAPEHSPSGILDFDAFSYGAVETIYCLTKVYEDKLDGSDEVALEFCLIGMEDRNIGTTNRYRIGMHHHGSGYKSSADIIEYKAKMSLAEWRSGIVDHALAMCDFVFQRFNWQQPDLVELRKLMDSLLARRL
jgi:hypothetical protein